MSLWLALSQPRLNRGHPILHPSDLPLEQLPALLLLLGRGVEFLLMGG